MSFEPFVAAAVQMVSGPVVSENLATAAGLIEEAAGQDARLIALPENFAIMGYAETDKLRVRESDGDGPIQHFLSDTACRFGVWLVDGSVPLAASAASRVHNSCLVYDDCGQRIARYDKIHLFDFEAGSERYCESDSIEPGSGPPVAFDSPFGHWCLHIFMHPPQGGSKPRNEASGRGTLAPVDGLLLPMAPSPETRKLVSDPPEGG